MLYELSHQLPWGFNSSCTTCLSLACVPLPRPSAYLAAYLRSLLGTPCAFPP